jgi:hypothetical protein
VNGSEGVLRINPNGVILLHFAHCKVVCVNMLAGCDRLCCESDDLVELSYGLPGCPAGMSEMTWS